MIIKILGGNINYFTLRLFLLLFCCVPTVIFSFQAFKKYATPSLAVALTAPLVIGFALLNDTDLVSFDSTYIPMVVLALAYYLLFSIGYLKNKVQGAVALGFVLGLFPFIKLQAVPVAVGLGVWLLYSAFFLWKLSLRSIVLILISSLAPCILVGIYIAVQDIHTDF